MPHKKLIGSLFYPSLLIISINFISCNTSSTTYTSEKKDSIILAYEVIPAERDTVQTTPVTEYFENVSGYDKEHGFYVALYETKETFHYKIKMCFKNLDGSDTLRIPNFGIWPKPVLKKGDKKYSCIAGFNDKQGNFKESKLIFDDDGDLRVRVLKRYAVATYQDSVK